MNKKKWMKLLVLISIIISFFVIRKIKYSIDLKPKNPKSKKQIGIRIVKNTTDKILANSLKRKGVIRSSSSFLKYMRDNKIKMSLGSYNVSPKMSVKEIADKVKSGKSDYFLKITFLEGWSMKKIIKQISDTFHVSERQVIGTINSRPFLESLAIKYPIIDINMVTNPTIKYPLEGYLFPDTYYYDSSTSVPRLIEQMVKRTSDIYNTQYKNVGLNVHQVLTLASIIEKEGKFVEDRQMMAYLFRERLRRKITLGSDVTSYYGVDVDLSERELTKAELEAANEYQTRTRHGLPIGPICSPSKDSIYAVFNSIKSNNLFFVSDKDGKIYFSRTDADNIAMRDKLIKEGKWYVYKR